MYGYLLKHKNECKQCRLSTYTKGLKDLLQWLLKRNYRDVSMESAGKYWIPIYNILFIGIFLNSAVPDAYGSFRLRRDFHVVRDNNDCLSLPVQFL